jgi:hypothetical protein
MTCQLSALSTFCAFFILYSILSIARNLGLGEGGQASDTGRITVKMPRQSQGLVAHTCNLSHAGGINQEDHSSTQA